MAGLTRPVVGLIHAQGQESETDIVARDQKLRLETPTESSISEIEFGHFDPVMGVLLLQLQDGQQLRVTGFPTEDKIPTGATGPQGDRGADGNPGNRGRDGETGEAGCEGPRGDRGPQGPPGRDGRKGMQGPPGLRGLTGPRGPIGPKGVEGVTGPTGPTGPRGDPGPAGDPGPDGAESTPNIVVSETDPGAVGPGVIWVDSSPPEPEEPPYVPPPDPTPGPEPEPEPVHCYQPSSGNPAGGIAFNCKGFLIAGSEMQHAMYDTSQYSEGAGDGMIFNIPIDCCDEPITTLRLYNSAGGNTLTMKLYFDWPGKTLYKSVKVPSGEARDMTLDPGDSRWRINNALFINGGTAATLTLVK